ncbi:hypothetical protein UlMin_026227 [Ulmus minor]
MEDNPALSLILRGCKLAKELETNLEIFSHEPNTVSSYCEEIAKVFSTAKERIGSHLQGASTSYNNNSMQESQHIDPSLQELLMIQNQLLLDNKNFREMRGFSQAKVDGVELLGSSSNSGHVPLMDISVSGRSCSSSSSQRPRRRKDDADVRTERVAAPQIGNTEIPPDDGQTWRKYGQKEIMGSRFPRAYYRCTHQKLYNCPAKKQVQRLDDDPFTFEVMYRGNHTCHMSTTAPSILPLQAVMTQEMTQAMSTITTTTSEILALPSWLSKEINQAEGGGRGGGVSSAAGTSTTSREVDQYPVVDMADVMFNPGSSSNNLSMDFIFHSKEDKSS